MYLVDTNVISEARKHANQLGKWLEILLAEYQDHIINGADL